MDSKYLQFNFVLSLVLLLCSFDALAGCTEDFYLEPTNYHIVVRGQCSTKVEAGAACTSVAASHGYSNYTNCNSGYSAEYGYYRWGGWFSWQKDVQNSPYTFAIYSYEGGEFVSPTKNMGAPKCSDNCFGDPINAGTGNKFESRTYYRGVGTFPLELSVTYNSKGSEFPQTRSAGMFGRNRTHFYARYLRKYQTPTTDAVYAYRPDGNAVKFVKSSGAWVGSDGLILREHLDAGAQVGWFIEAGSQGREYYSLAGRLLYLEGQNGRRQTLVFNSKGEIEKVIDDQGRSMGFIFHSSGRVLKATLPDGGAIEFVYSTSGDLVEVKHQDGTVGKYLYDEPTYNAATATGAMTGELDEVGVRFQTTTYDSQGRATSTSFAGGVDTVTAMYTESTGGQYNQSAKISTSSGGTRSVSFSVVNGEVLAASSINTCPGCEDDAVIYGFDPYGRIDVLSKNGVTTEYNYSPDGLMLGRKEAINTADERKTEVFWDSDKRVPIEITTAGVSGGVAYRSVRDLNARGQVTSETESDGTTAANRTTSTIFCEAADIDVGSCPLLGLPISVDGARDDVSDYLLFNYRMEAAPTCASSSVCDYRKGDLWKVTNAKGQVTETLKYDGAGRVLSVKDPNGVITDFEYHPRGWLTASKVRGTNDAVETDDAITRIDYWPTGLVKRVTQPDGAFTQYSYDPAHRLTDITDNAGNTIHYVLDNAGHRIAEETKDAGGTLKRSLSRVYNQLGQLATQADAQANPTDFTYDANGNANTVTDALGRVTDHDHDPLNRLARTLQDVGGIAAETKFQYDALDQLTKVTDPKGLDTTYTYNGLGDLTKLQSPDTGTTTYTYDSAGNRATQTDARGVTTTYAYDVLNRLTAVSYPDTSLNVGYTYDTTPAVCEAGEIFSVGRLSGMDDASGSTRYCYNRFGHLVRKVQTTNGVSFVVRYAYTLGGNLQAMVYPDGTTVDYGRNAQGQVTEVGVTRSGQPRQVLLNQAAYHPFGPVAGWTYGNGRTLTRTLDQDYRPLTIEDPNAGGLSLGFGYDAVGNLTQLGTAQGMANPAIGFGYDALGRLTRTEDGLTQAAIDVYAYDATGNRTAHTTAAGTAAYTYPPTSHRLTEVAGVPRTYDAVGNTTAIGTNRSFAYNDANRMSGVQQAAVATRQYAYNGRGEQVRRYLGTTNTYTVYDEAGHWLGDYDDTGAPIQQALWMDDLPVGLLANAHQLHYVQPDHLGSPRVVIEAARNVPVWSWDLKGEAFGSTAPQQDPDGDGIPFVLDMRFPGQRYDAASMLNQNYHRDYDAFSGRYAQSDPLGLRAGWDKYSYVDSSPTMGSDIAGLLKVILFGPKDDPIFHQRASEYKDVPEECLVYSHGSPSFIYDTRSGKTKMIDDPKEIIRILTESGCTGEMPVTFFSCRTGMGENSIAEQVSKEGFFPSVSGPTNYIWYNYDSNASGPTQIYGKNPGPSPNLEDPGILRRFPQ